jgi:hypothetical protein
MSIIWTYQDTKYVQIYIHFSDMFYGTEGVEKEQDATSFISAAMFFRVSSPSPIISKPSSCTISLPRRCLVRQKFSHLVEAQNESKEK